MSFRTWEKAWTVLKRRTNDQSEQRAPTLISTIFFFFFLSLLLKDRKTRKKYMTRGVIINYTKKIVKICYKNKLIYLRVNCGFFINFWIKYNFRPLYFKFIILVLLFFN